MTTRQASLFDEPPPGPPGFAYWPRVIAAAEEAALVDALSRLDFQAFEMQGHVARRRVAFFGLRYDGGLRPAAPIPDVLRPLRDKAAALAGIAPEALVHALVNQYPPGAPIGWHRDKAVFGEVVGFSLLSPCVLRFRRALGTSWERSSLTLEPRSGYVLKGEARSTWEHSIPPVEHLRYSVTFRTLASGAGASSRSPIPGRAP